MGAQSGISPVAFPMRQQPASIDKKEGDNRREMGEKDREGMCNKRAFRTKDSRLTMTL